MIDDVWDTEAWKVSGLLCSIKKWQQNRYHTNVRCIKLLKDGGYVYQWSLFF